MMSGFSRPIISIVLGSYNRLPYLKLTVQSIRNEIQDLSHEIIVVDGGSTDGALEWLLAQKDIITIVQHNRGEWMGKAIRRRSWGYFMNLAFKCAQGKFICMISDDSIFVPGALKNGIDRFESAHASGKNVGAVAFYWRSWPHETVYHVGTPMGTHMYVNHGLYLNDALRSISYIDEETFEFYFADIDLCMRLWDKGYVCIDAPDSFVEHYAHANLDVRKTNEAKADKDFKTFLARWQQKFPALTNHSIGTIKTLAYTDTANIGEQFVAMHAVVVQDNPKMFAPPSFAQKVYGAVHWKVKCAYRQFMARF